MRKFKAVKEKHGMTDSREYRAWCHALGRCYCETDEKYSDYGARGIRVCARWELSFVKFYEDMGRCPEGYTLGRIENDGDYSPENCQWETPAQQSRNKRNNVYVIVDGKDYVVADAVNKLGIHYTSLHQRVRKFGGTIQDAADHFWKRKLSGKRYI